MLLTRSFALVGLVALLVGLTGAAVGQVPDSTAALTATLIGRVVDTAGVAVADAEVVVIRSGDSTVVGTAKSDKQGNATVRHLSADGSYTIVARKIGYGPARGEVQFQRGDTLYVDFELPASAMVLAAIEVTARRNPLSITADQFNPKQFVDAAIMLALKRRDMLGDPKQCPPPDTIFWGPSPEASGLKITKGLSLFGGKPRSWQRPWLNIYALSFDNPPLPYVQRLYVNGQRVDWTRLDGTVVPGRSVLEELRRIPKEIAEIRYVDCRNQSVPPEMQYALYVTLKPPSREVQDSILKAVRAVTPRRQVWDSILRSLDMRDSTSP